MIKNRILQIALAFLFVCAILFSASISIRAQNQEFVEPEIKQYVEEKGQTAKVPADISNLVRGDLNKDGAEDVIIQYYVQIGYPGNLTNTYLTAFLSKKGKMTLAAETDAAVVLSKIENGIILCDKYGEGAKKFDKVGTVKFKLVKQKLVEVKTKK